MFKHRQITAAINLTAAAFLLVFNCWLQFNHGHDASVGLFPGSGDDQCRIILAEGQVHRHKSGEPAIESHEFELILSGRCLICVLFNWNSRESTGPDEISDVGYSVDDPIPAITPESVSRISAYFLRAPPVSA